MSWRVYHAKKAYASALDTAFVDLYIKMTVGKRTGNFPLGYFVTDGALDFSDAGYYSLKRNNMIEVANETGIENSSVKLPDFDLSQNYPNPFNATTTIEFYLPAGGQTQVQIFNLKGEEVATVMNQFLAGGKHQIQLNLNGLNSGIYYYRLNTQQRQLIKRFLYLK